MIPIPVAWSYQPGDDLLTLIAPEGAAAGVIKYKGCNHPLLRLGRIIELQLHACPRFAIDAMSQPERLTTREGEHAAVVGLDGREAGQPAHRVIGVVFGEGSYSILSALCVDAQYFARLRPLVRDLVLTESLELGVRRRRFEYTPPVDWQPLPTELMTEWFPPGFPGDVAILTVYPTIIRRLEGNELGGKEVFSRQVAALERAACTIVSRLEPAPFSTQGGLTGALYRVEIDRPAPTLREHKTGVIFEDERYLYPIDLTVHNPKDGNRHLDVLAAVARSVVAVPVSEDVRRLEDRSHWALRQAIGLIAPARAAAPFGGMYE